MADDSGAQEESEAYLWLLWGLRGLVQWAAFLIGGCGTVLIFFIWWFERADNYGLKYYSSESAGKCYGTGTAGVTKMAACRAASLLDLSAMTAAQKAAFITCTYADVTCKGYDDQKSQQNPNPTGKCNSFRPPADMRILRELATAAEKPDPWCAGDDGDLSTWCRRKCIAENTCSLTSGADGFDEAASKNGGISCGPFKDNNRDWRQIFTLQPNIFLDVYTPIFLGGIEFIQHLGAQYTVAALSGTWLVRAIWLFALSLFGQFGYAGDVGVLFGWMLNIGVTLPCIVLAILDHQSDVDGRSHTTADVVPALKNVLTAAGLDFLCPGLAGVKAREIGTKEQASA